MGQKRKFERFKNFDLPSVYLVLHSAKWTASALRTASEVGDAQANLSSDAKQLSWERSVCREITIIREIRHVGSPIQQYQCAWAIATCVACGGLRHRYPGIRRRYAGAGGHRGYRFSQLTALRQRYASHRSSGASDPERQRPDRQYPGGRL